MTCRSPILHFLRAENRRKKVINSDSRLPSFFSKRALINLGPKSADRLQRRRRPRAAIDCGVFPFQFVINALAPSSPPAPRTWRSPSRPPETRRALSVHNTFIRGRGGGGTGINTTSENGLFSTKSHIQFDNNKHGTPLFRFECM